MLKKLGIPALVLAAMSMLAPQKADARVRFHVGVGVGPAYTAPYPYGGVYIGGGHYHHWHRR